MPITYNGQDIAVHTINVRTDDPQEYWPSFKSLVRLTDTYDLDGILCFSANETLIDPWVAAHYLIMHSRRLEPIVALNPMYMHPFAAAKMVSSFAYMHGRRTILNLIAGASLRDREVMHQNLSHDALYDRLREYSIIVNSLLRKTGAVNFDGSYYRISDAVLSPPLAEELQPKFLVSGQSQPAQSTAAAVDAMSLRMLAPNLEEGLGQNAAGTGIHLGIIARDTAEEAWAVAHARFEADPETEGMLDFMMESSDSVWKRKMYEKVSNRDDMRPQYWLEPFRLLRSDCPYLVGSHREVAEILAAHVRRGVEAFILDLPPLEDEFQNISKCISFSTHALSKEVVVN